MLGAAVDVHTPVDPRALERAGDTWSGLQRGLRSLYAKERAGHVGPDLGAGVWPAGADYGNGLERHPSAGKSQHDPAAGTEAEGSEPVWISTRHRE